MRRLLVALPVLALLSTASPAQAQYDDPVPDARLTIAATGDLLIHSPVWTRARRPGGRYRFAPMFRYVKPYISGADVGLCHVETPLTTGTPSGYPRFNTPGDLATDIRSTGWDVCSTASNHSLDRGQRGIDATSRILDRAGVAHTGSFRSPAERDRSTILDVRGVKVAFLSYTALTNGLRRPHRWSLNLARAKTVLSDARRARRRGARVVVVNVHWGDEFRHRPNAQQVRLARELTRSPDVTAIVGQHAHVVQPIRRINGKLVVFGEGNLISNQTAACCPAASQDGLIALLTVAVDQSGDRVEAVEYVPTWVRHPDFAVLPVRRALRERWAGAAALRRSYRRTVAVVGRGPGYRPAR
jgi:poly-gamma-glutamate capsule biosynthesis protein CapA/YwtB (metallophosphatase superfamily)